MLNTLDVRPLPQFLWIELDRRHPRRYHEDAVWRCLSRLTGEWSTIGGGLAQVLTKYPWDYELKLIAAPACRRRRVRDE
jgi:hypothetical protein